MRAALIVAGLVVSVVAPRITSASPTAYLNGLITNKVYVIDAQYDVIRTARTGFAGPEGVSITQANGKTYVANNSNGTISVIDSPTDTVQFTFGTAAGPVGLSTNPSATRLYVANATNNSLSVHDISNPNATPLFLFIVMLGASPQDVIVSPDGTRIYVALSNGNVDAYSTADPPTLIGSVAVGGSPSRLALPADGSRLFVANATVVAPIIDTATLTQTLGIYTATACRGVAVNAAGTTAYVARDSNVVSFYDVSSAPVFLGQVVVGSIPSGVALTPDETKLYVANTGGFGSGNTVSVLDAVNRTLITTITLDSGAVGPLGIGRFIGDPETPCTGTCFLSDVICAGRTAYGLAINTSVLPWSRHNLNGCTLADLCPCASPLGRVKWLNATEYKNCVKNGATEYMNLGLITSGERTTINNGIGNTICGT